MYTYKSTVGLMNGIGSSWKTYDTATVSMREMFLRFNTFYILAHDSVIDREIIINTKPYQTNLAGLDITVREWLDSMDGIPVAQVDRLPTDGMKYAQYANAIQRGYKFYPDMLGYTVPGNYPIAGLKDTRIERPDIPTDLTLLHTHCMLSVEGLFHRSDSDGTYPYIIDGNTTGQRVRCAHVGILSFLGIGKVTMTKFKTTDVIPLTEGQPLKKGMILRYEGDLEGKTVFMVLGGYLVRPSELTFYKNSDNTWVFQPTSIPYVERYMETRKILDLSSMTPIVEDNGDPGMNVNQESLWSDEVLRQYFDLSQSFWVAIDTDQLFFEQVGIRVSTLPGYLASSTEPVYPLIAQYGQMLEYSPFKEGFRWALRVTSHYYRKYLFGVNLPPLVHTVSDHLAPWQQSVRTTAYMLRIGAKPKTT